MPTDVWQQLTKAALRLVNERQSDDAPLDADEITETALGQLDHLTNVAQYRARLKAFVKDISQS